MNRATRYRYEKRIKDLTDQVIRLQEFKEVAIDIFRETAQRASDGGGMNKSWILSLFARLLR